MSSSLLPIIQNAVPAGFPSPATDLIEESLDLQKYLVKHPSSTFFIKVVGSSMRDAGILSGDIIVIDRSLEPVTLDIVLAVLNGEFTVKKFQKTDSEIYLIPENKNYEVIKVNEADDFFIWGVVTSVIRKIH